MKHLVIIPTVKPSYILGFSAPLAWLFSSHTDQVTGIYGFQLNDELAGSYDSFIVDLNWYFELYEFTLLVNFIKKRNPNANMYLSNPVFKDVKLITREIVNEDQKGRFYFLYARTIQRKVFCK